MSEVPEGSPRRALGPCHPSLVAVSKPASLMHMQVRAERALPGVAGSLSPFLHPHSHSRRHCPYVSQMEAEGQEPVLKKPWELRDSMCLFFRGSLASSSIKKDLTFPLNCFCQSLNSPTLCLPFYKMGRKLSALLFSRGSARIK